MKKLKVLLLIIIAFSMVINIYLNDSISGKYILNKDLISQISSNNENYVKIDKIPKELTDAIVSVEDKRFFKHNGFDIIGIARATVRNIEEKRFVEGGSTITQQLAKNLFLTNKKSLNRKFKELILAVKLERLYTKKEIIEMYLNVIYYGAGSYGIEEASQTYFNKSVEDITLSECTILAGLPQAPSLYNPKENLEKAKKRQEIVLGIMVKNKLISSEMEKRIKNQNVLVYQ